MFQKKRRSSLDTMIRENASDDVFALSHTILGTQYQAYARNTSLLNTGKACQNNPVHLKLKAVIK